MNDDTDASAGSPLQAQQHRPSEVSFDLPTSKEHNGRATQIRLFTNKRPHMRAFHCAWIGFFAAFFMWFSITPLLSVIAQDLQLTRKQLWVSTMCNDIATILARLLVGPLCDVLGARLLLASILALVSIPTALTGTIRTFGGLCALRFFVGISGSSFVTAQYWMGQMFVKEVIGTANAIVAGWGNLGGGVAQLVMGAGLFPLFQLFTTEEQAWRSIFVIPAVGALMIAFVIARVSDDGPGGYYKEMKKNGTMDIRAASFVRFADSKNAWLLAFAYACSFGVEITFNNAGSLYFQDEFGLSVEAAAAAASVFGFTNLFARAVGGILSDRMNQKLGMQGRLLLACTTSLLLGGTAIGFAFCDTLAASIPVMVIFSSMVHATEGAIFGIVPYINPANAGSIAGIVGMGGNFGGLFFAVAFYQLSYRNAFLVMGGAAACSSLVYSLVHLPGCSQLLSRKNAFLEQGATEPPPATDIEMNDNPSVAPVVEPLDSTEADSPDDTGLPVICEEEETTGPAAGVP